MRIVLVTTRDDPLGGVFSRSYLAAGGVCPEWVVVLPSSSDQGFSIAGRALVIGKLLRPWGVARLLLTRLGIPLPADRKAGLGRRWPGAIAGPDTKFLFAPEKAPFSPLLELKDEQPDLLVSVGAPVILPPSVLEIARIGAVNVHNGLLPRYRGHFGTFWEVYHGEEWGYVFLHEMEAKVDAGRVVAWDRLRIPGVGSFLDLMLEKKKMGGRLLAQVVERSAREGRLPDSLPLLEEQTSSYFGWPALKDLIALRPLKTSLETDPGN